MNVFLSGSSATLLSREIATAMRGRSWTVLMHPSGFDEYLGFRGRDVPDPRSITSDRRSSLEAAFLDYLTVGGFPEIQNFDAGTRRRVLGDYVDVAMIRDIMERHSVTNIAGLRWLVRHLLSNPGGLFSVEKFHAALKSQGIAIAKDTCSRRRGTRSTFSPAMRTARRT